MRILILIVILTGVAFTSSAQWVCGTPQQEQHRREEYPHVESIEDFEKWMREQQPGGDAQYVQERAYVVPVVFHVIHNGEPVGKGANVSDERLLASLKQLNDDFQRKNSDTVDTPTAFRHLVGKMNIQFILARQDPNGVPTRGIVRVKGAKKEWDYLNEEEFKAISYWSAQDYLNIWIVNFVENDATKKGVLIGYAQFPESDLIKGLTNSSSNEKTDGVTLLPNTIANDSLYKHILTHEVGHFLGLRHVWGGEGCNYDGDYVSDTPLQESATSGCPDFPVTQCSNSIMFHNYMDYSKCTNLFTQGQVSRMKIILNNSPRRKSLLTSKGGTTPVFIENDIKISTVLSPKKRSCGVAVIPRIAVANWGKHLLSSARIKLSVDGATEQVKIVTFSTALKQFEYDTLSFNPLNLSALPQGEHTLNFEALQVNEVDDEQPENSIISLTTSVPKHVEIPFFETFSKGIGDWEIVSSDRSTSWKSADTHDNGGINKSVYINFHKYEKNNTTDQLISPAIRLGKFDDADIQHAQLRFNWFYASQYDYPDQLQVMLTTGCRYDADDAVLLFDKSGKALSTFSPPQPNKFVPSSASQWGKIIIPLKESIATMMKQHGGKLDDLEIMFITTSEYGSRLYIDNVSLSLPKDAKLPYEVYAGRDFKDTNIIFHLDSPENVKVDVYDLLGQLVSESTLQQAWREQYTINTGVEQPGIYLLRVYLKSGSKTTRIFISP